MSAERGNLSINSENIFPIIKKWLYSDHDIFIRELISNGCDAITKLKKLEIMGETELEDDEDLSVSVYVNQEEKTIRFVDTGIGMDADEIKEYINQIAFSGAKDFVEKYKDKTNEDQIIGHFGLGFYSAFMVAHKVVINTLSYKEGAKAVHWESEEGLDFEMEEGTKEERGTEIILYLNEDSYEFSNEYKAKEVIQKYCSFMPVPIYFVNENAKEEKTENKEVVDATVSEDGKAVEDGKKEERKSLNETTPLWTKHPNDCTEEDYKKFYREVFHDYKEPLFWIHLNMDYPFNLKGILYFPKINTEYDSIEGTIKLYSNQVFIADNIKEVIPEFLLLLKGVIDCPDLPLNVSRSALQNDGFVKKISDYITKKVADKLSGMFKTDKENYEKFWDDICPFIKYGCLKDDKFREKMNDYILFKDLEGKYLTLKEYVEAEKAKKGDKTEEEQKNSMKEDAKDNDLDNSENEEADENGDNEKAEEDTREVVYYVTDLVLQSQYVNMFKSEGINALILTHNIDQPFIGQLEYQNKDLRFQRIDAEVTDSFRSEEGKKELKKLEKKLVKLFKDKLNNDKLTVKVEMLKNSNIASFITLSEEDRRMQDMMKMYNMGGNADMFPTNKTLVLNANHNLVKYLAEHEKDEGADLFVAQLYDLALLSHQPLAADEMTAFIERSNKIMMLLAEK
ncbi:MAG: molecular chaperone HtpG [Lachnospiraceae bacterium]|nr:molecular chaperone HtpG [Lachnospiraceae bacterium]